MTFVGVFACDAVAFVTCLTVTVVASVVVGAVGVFVAIGLCKCFAFVIVNTDFPFDVALSISWMDVTSTTVASVSFVEPSRTSSCLLTSIDIDTDSEEWCTVVFACETFVYVVTFVSRPGESLVAFTAVDTIVVDALSVVVAIVVSVLAFVNVVATNCNLLSDAAGTVVSAATVADVVSGYVDTLGVVVTTVVITIGWMEATFIDVDATTIFVAIASVAFVAFAHV